MSLNNCTLCEFKSTSEKGLKIHFTKMHKNELFAANSITERSIITVNNEIDDYALNKKGNRKNGNGNGYKGTGHDGNGIDVNGMDVYEINGNGISGNGMGDNGINGNGISGNGMDDNGINGNVIKHDGRTESIDFTSEIGSKINKQ